MKNTKQGNYRGDTYTTKKSADQIFDHAFKKMLTLSSKAVTNMINGLFGTEPRSVHDNHNLSLD